MHKSGIPGHGDVPRVSAGLGPLESTVQRIRGMSTDASFQKGGALHAGGWVTSAQVDGGDLTARVKDRRLYRVHVRPGPDGGIFCTCGSRRACAHAVAALLYASDNLNGLLAEERNREGARDMIRRVSGADLQKFLESEIKRDADVRRRFLIRFGGSDGVPRVDYRGEVDAMFGDVDYMTSRRDRLSFAEFFRAAKARERRGHAAEAIRICLEVSEAIESNHHLVDDSSGYYADTLGRAVLEMAACINRQNMDHDEKRPHIFYLHRQFLTEVPALNEDLYYQALVNVCTGRADLEYLVELNGPHLPEGRISGEDKYDLISRMCLHVEALEKLDRWEDAGRMLEGLYRNSIDACGAYVELLLRHDPARAQSVLEEARSIFPGHQFGHIRHLADGAD